MRRVFTIGVRERSRCGGKMRIQAAMHPPEAARKILLDNGRQLSYSHMTVSRIC